MRACLAGGLHPGHRTRCTRFRPAGGGWGLGLGFGGWGLGLGVGGWGLGVGGWGLAVEVWSLGNKSSEQQKTQKEIHALAAQATHFHRAHWPVVELAQQVLQEIVADV